MKRSGWMLPAACALICFPATGPAIGRAAESPLALTFGAARGVSPRTAPLRLDDAVRDKNFPVLALLQSPRAQRLLRDDALLQSIAYRQRARLTVAMDACAGVAACYVEAALWPEEDQRAAEEALRARCRAAAAACAQVMRELRAGGTMIRFQGRDDAGLLAAAWMLQAGSVDRVLRVYGLGMAPRYPAIDAMASDPQSREFAMRLREEVQEILRTDPAQRPFFGDALQFALALLALDGRDDAGRFEPLERGENRAAHRQIRRLRWARYTYSAILVPGQGPEQPGVRLDPLARQRLAAAVERYRSGAAPLLIVSGGYVHPARTPYCEALEMKHALMQDFGVPGEAILIEPHARHTTTNLRNSARLLYRYGVPPDRPVLIVTDERQAAYIASAGFDERNLNETGVLPYRDKRRLSATEVEVVPVVDALQVGFEDALDP